MDVNDTVSDSKMAIFYIAQIRRLTLNSYLPLRGYPKSLNPVNLNDHRLMHCDPSNPTESVLYDITFTLNDFWPDSAPE